MEMLSVRYAACRCIAAYFVCLRYNQKKTLKAGSFKRS